jgi:hypothetical protein
MRTASIRVAASATALSLLAAGVVAVLGTGTAVAQNTVTTQKYLIGNGSVTDATAVAQPDTAGATANYTLGFTTPTALSRGSDNVNLSDPDASTTFPGALNDYFIIDNTNSSGDQPVSSANLATGGHSVTLGLSQSVAARDSLSVYVIGATNPGVGSYSLDISTSQNPSPSSTAAYQIVAAAQAPSFSPAATPPLGGGPSTYAIGAFKAASDMKAGDQVQVSSFASSGTNDNVRFPRWLPAYKVTDLTSGQTIKLSAVSLGGISSGDTGEAVTLTLAGHIAAGDELAVTISRVHNPSTAQSDTLTAAAPAGAQAVSANLTIGTAVANPTISLSQTGASSTGVEYTVGFSPVSDLAAGGTISLVAPGGTSFAGASVVVLDVTHSAASGNIPAASVKTSSSGSSSPNELTFSVPNAISAGDSVFVEVQGVTNPAAGSYGGAAGDFAVGTSSDAIPATVPAYVVTAAPAPLLARIEVTPRAPGSTAEYIIGDLKASAPLAAGTSTIELKAPSGTSFPSSVSDYTVADLRNLSASAHPSSVSGGGTDDVVLSLGANIADGDSLDVVAEGVTNPPSGTYQVSLVGDLSAALTPRSAPPVPPRPVPHPQPVWPKFLTTGALVMTPHHSYVVIGHSVLPLLGERVLVAVRVKPHHRVVLRWSYRVQFTPAMAKHFVELRISERRWIRWTGRMFRVQVLGQLVR